MRDLRIRRELIIIVQETIMNCEIFLSLQLINLETRQCTNFNWFYVSLNVLSHRMMEEWNCKRNEA